MLKKIYLSLFIIIQSTVSINAQQMDFSIGHTIEFESEILTGKRKIWIYVPDVEENSLTNPQTVFPVLYVLDAEDDFLNTVGISKALIRASLMPNVIVVGITGAQREFDYSPSDLKVDYMKTGGGIKFLPFMTNELIPYINANYPSSNHNTIIGHSIGAMFSLFALAENSSSFDSFLAISPSLWWDNQSLAEDWIQRLKSYSPHTKKTAFVTMANERTLGQDGQKMHNQYLNYKNELKDSHNFTIGFMDLFDEDHLSTVTPATHHGLKYLYQNWNLDSFYNSNDFTGLKEAIKALSEIYRFNVVPSYSQIVNMGRHFHNEKDYKTAIEIYELGLESYPNGLQILGFAAQSYSDNGTKKKAKEYFEKGLKIAKSNESPMISWFENQLEELK